MENYIKYIRVWWKNGTVEDIEVTDDHQQLLKIERDRPFYVQFHSTTRARAIGGEFGPRGTWSYSDWR